MDVAGGIVVKIVVLVLLFNHAAVVYGCVKVISLSLLILIAVSAALLLDLAMLAAASL